MKKSYIFLIILILLGIFGIAAFFRFKNNKVANDSNYDSAKLSSNETFEESSNTDNTSDSQNENDINADNENATNENNEETNTSKEEQSSDENAATNTQPEKNTTTNSTETKTSKQETETQIADFTTKIYSKDKERQNNISITCSSLNNTTVNNGETFSFCSTVGKSTSSKGYEKADVYQDGEVVQALGGGNCQVSSTLYNAVLKVSGLKVTERHEHSNSVPYVAKGKDAAVAYGSYDFKFVNNTGNKIKITASADNSYVYIKIFKLS